jgi:hypothetical protein
MIHFQSFNGPKYLFHLVCLGSSHADVIVHHGVLVKGVDFVKNPFNMKDLANKVREVIGKS